MQCAPPTATTNPDLTTEQSNRSANQAKLLAAGALEALVAAALQGGGVPSAPVRAAALLALGDLVDGQAAGQEKLAASHVRPGELSQSVASGSGAAAGGGAGAAWAPPGGQYGGDAYGGQGGGGGWGRGGSGGPGQGGAGPGAGPQPGELPALQAALHVALYGSDGAERTAADHVIGCYCQGNADGQLALAGTIGAQQPPQHPHAPGGGANGYGPGPMGHAGRPGAGYGGPGGYPGSHERGLPSSSFGSDLVLGLLSGGGAVAAAAAQAGSSAAANGGAPGRYGGGGSAGGAASTSGAGQAGLYVTCRAASVLQHLLYGNPLAKQKLLATPLEAGQGQGQGLPPELLMPRLLRHLTAVLRPPSAEANQLVAVTVLRVLLVWVHECPQAVSALLDGSAHLPLLVDLATGRQGPALPDKQQHGGPGGGGGGQGGYGGYGASGPASGQFPLSALTAGGAGGYPGQQGPSGGSAGPSGAGAGDALVCGLAACVLAACILYGKPQQAGHGPAAPAPQSTCDLVLDVVMSRIGLSHFFYRLDDLRRHPALAAAMAPLQQPQAAPPPRQSAGGAEAAGGGGGGGAGVADPFGGQAGGGGGAGGSGAARRDASFSAPGAPGGGGGAGGDGAAGVVLLGRDVAVLVAALEAAVRQRAMELFSRPAGFKPQDAPLSAAELPGPDDTARLGAALGVVGRMVRELDELRARNRALAEDLFRLSQQGALSAPPPPASAGVPGAGQAPGGGPASAPGMGGAAGAGAGAGAAPGAAGASMTAADMEARVALELRANRAEAEAASLRQQVEVMHARLHQAEADAHAAREAAAQAHSAASKAEADLGDLSGAYNTLEAHAFNVEAQLRSAEGQLRSAQAALAQAQQAAQQAAQHPAAPAGLSEAEVQQRVEAAVAAAREEAQQEADDGMTDLLVCLGQEERKVQVLGEQLAARGVDVEALLASIAAEEEGEGEGEEGLQ